MFYLSFGTLLCIFDMIYGCIYLILCVPVRVCVGFCMSKRDETNSDLIQLKTNALFRPKTSSWKQAGFPGYQTESQNRAIQTETKRKRDVQIKGTKKGIKK